LINFRGVLQCDGYTVYDKIGKSCNKDLFRDLSVREACQAKRES